MKFLSNHKNIVILLFILMSITTVWLLIRPEPKIETDIKYQEIKSKTDALMKLCSGGVYGEKESKISGEIANYFMGIKTGASVSKNDVGAIFKNISANETGGKIYESYKECVTSNINIIIPPPSSEKKSSNELKELSNKINEINPNSPKEKIVEVLGNPFSEEFTTEDIELTDVLITRYQYKNTFFLADYHKDNKRLGLVLGYLAQDKSTQPYLNVKNLQNIKLSDIVEICSGDEVDVSSHGVISTKVCGGSHADNFESQVYFFGNIEDVDMNSQSNCNYIGNEKLSITAIKKCDNLGKAKPYAVALGMNQDDLNRVKNLFIYESDFGKSFNYVSDEGEL